MPRPSAHSFVALCLGLCLLALSNSCLSFQIAPLGSSFEATLTNESESRLRYIAEYLGFLIKDPVHEELTQLGFGCPAERDQLDSNTACSGRDRPFASPFVIYGVRWNDLPPFKLEDNQGKGCKKILGGAPACLPQTVRFSTQPECWYCLFKQASVTAMSRKITKCQVGKGYEKGNLMTRSHFGDLQFLHSMANEEGTSAETTQAKIVQWLEFAWRVSSEEFASDRSLATIEIPVIKEHFGCTGWDVSDIYILGRKNRLLDYLPEIAFGSVLHTIQDSFARGHVERESPVVGEKCPNSSAPHPGRVVEFHAYGKQDAKKHDAEDERSAMASAARERWPEAIEATRHVVNLYRRNQTWEEVRPYIECLYELSPRKRNSSAGDGFRRVAN